jgi:hypothetical protein
MDHLTVAFPFDHDEGKLSGLDGLLYCPNSVLPAVLVALICSRQCGFSTLAPSDGNIGQID